MCRYLIWLLQQLCDPCLLQRRIVQDLQVSGIPPPLGFQLLHVGCYTSFAMKSCMWMHQAVSIIVSCMTAGAA